MKHCGNCARSDWMKGKADVPDECLICATDPNPEPPSQWKAKADGDLDGEPVAECEM